MGIIPPVIEIVKLTVSTVNATAKTRGRRREGWTKEVAQTRNLRLESGNAVFHKDTLKDEAMERRSIRVFRHGLFCGSGVCHGSVSNNSAMERSPAGFVVSVQ